MSEQKTGITFNETMSGGLALGATDPLAGDRQGKNAGHVMAMHATITIHDLEAFLADPHHHGDITGTIDYPAFGDGIPAKTGVFNLFSPTDNPKLRLMIYEMGFSSGGKDYYLAGQKNVEDDNILHLWSATTTLYTKLYEGNDKSGPVVGAGVLSLGPIDLLKMVRTMRATNAEGAVASAAAVAKFGQFFMGKLWATYVSHS
jgi:choline dehydrogenase-like flavoprotein